MFQTRKLSLLILALYLLINVVSIDGGRFSGGRSSGWKSSGGRSTSSGGWFSSRSSSPSSSRSYSHPSNYGSSHSFGSSGGSSSLSRSYSHPSNYGSIHPFGSSGGSSKSSSSDSNHLNTHSQASKPRKSSGFGSKSGRIITTYSNPRIGNTYNYDSNWDLFPSISRHDSSSFENTNFQSSYPRFDNDFSKSKEESSGNVYVVQSTTTVKPKCSKKTKSASDPEYLDKLLEYFNSPDCVQQRYQNDFFAMITNTRFDANNIHEEMDSYFDRALGRVPCEEEEDDQTTTERFIDPTTSTTTLATEILTTTEADAVVQFVKNKENLLTNKIFENNLNTTTQSSVDVPISTTILLPEVSKTVPELKTTTLSSIEYEDSAPLAPFDPLTQAEHWEMPGASIIYHHPSNEIMLAENSNIYIASGSKSKHLSFFSFILFIMVYSFH